MVKKYSALVFMLSSLLVISLSYFLPLNKYREFGLDGALDCESPERILMILVFGFLISFLGLVMLFLSWSKVGFKVKLGSTIILVLALGLGIYRFSSAIKEKSQVHEQCLRL